MKIKWVSHVLNRKEKKRRRGLGGVLLLSSYTPCNEVHSVLIIAMMEETVYLWDSGQEGVGCMFNCEEERRHSMEYTYHPPPLFLPFLWWRRRFLQNLKSIIKSYTYTICSWCRHTFVFLFRPLSEQQQQGHRNILWVFSFFLISSWSIRLDPTT